MSTEDFLKENEKIREVRDYNALECARLFRESKLLQRRIDFLLAENAKLKNENECLKKGIRK